jgi:hypothetical protein
MEMEKRKGKERTRMGKLLFYSLPPQVLFKEPKRKVLK